VTIPQGTAKLLAAATLLLALSAGCASDPSSQIGAATDVAIDTSVRSLPGVTNAAVTESGGPSDTVMVALTTVFDPASDEDRASATALLMDAANMVYTVRHDTFRTVSVTVYGASATATAAQPGVVLAQRAFTSATLAAGGH
jgi:hypothetical protein